MEKITIIGTGAYASALAQVLADNNNEVLMYGIEQDEIDDINQHHTNTKYFEKDITLNPTIKATNDLEKAVGDAKTILFAVPSAALPTVCEQVNKIVKHPVHFINIAKGFDPKTGERLSIMIHHNLKPEIVAALSGLYGPSFAKEIVQRFPTQVTAVSEKIEYAKKVQKLFNSPSFSVVISDDVAGVEYAGALKNVIAIISGMLKGQGASDSTIASFITIGLNEAIKFSVKNGAKQETFLTPAGIGDLILTAMSPQSRNYQFGFAVGQTNDPKKVIEQSKTTVEGYKACHLVMKQANEQNIKLPLFNALHEILFNFKNPQEVINGFLKELLVIH